MTVTRSAHAPLEFEFGKQTLYVKTIEGKTVAKVPVKAQTIRQWLKDNAYTRNHFLNPEALTDQCWNF